MTPLFRLTILLMILSLPYISSAQGRKPPKGQNYKRRLSTNFKVHELLSIYGSLGVTNYYGDLCDNFKCIQPRPGLGVGLIYRLSDNFSSKSEINYLRLYSKDVWEDRNLSFRSGNLEIYSSIMYDYYKFTKNIRKRRLLSPYVFLGVGVTFYNPRAKLDGKWHSLRPLKTEGKSYGIVTPVIPIGFGVKIKHTRKWDFLVEGGYRITFTDHLDDVSSYQFQNSSEFNDPVAASLSNRTQEGDAFRGYRGNPKKNDGYLVLAVKARYTFTSRHVFKHKYQEQHRKIF